MPDLPHATPFLLYVPLAGNAGLALLAGFWAVGRQPLPAWFWAATLVVLAVLAVQIGVGVVLFLSGARPRDALHLLYGILVSAAGVIQYGLRPGGFLRRAFARGWAGGEARIVALIWLTQAALLARAWMTGLGAGSGR